MNKSHSRTSDRPKKSTRHRHSAEEIQYLLSAEEQILESISIGAPLPEVLDGICAALDCQIGNVVSFISLPGEDAGELATIARNAQLFDLFAFCSEGVFAENEKLLGTLEMYCCVSRSPSASELRLIERAKVLAAIAIQREMESSHPANGRVPENLWPQRNLHAGRVYVN